MDLDRYIAEAVEAGKEPRIEVQTDSVVVVSFEAEAGGDRRITSVFFASKEACQR